MGGVQASREKIRPAVIAIERRERAVGYRGTERDHDRRVGRRDHVDRIEEEPGNGGVEEGPVTLVGAVRAGTGGRDIVCLHRLGVPGHRPAGAANVEAHGELPPGQHRARRIGRVGQFDGIAIGGLPRRHHDGALAALERHWPVAAAYDRGAAVLKPDIHVGEGDGCAPDVLANRSRMRRPQRSGFTIRRKVWSLAPCAGEGNANFKSGCGPGMPVGYGPPAVACHVTAHFSPGPGACAAAALATAKSARDIVASAPARRRTGPLVA